MKIIISQIYKNINEMSNDIHNIHKKINNVDKLYNNYKIKNNIDNIPSLIIHNLFSPLIVGITFIFF